MGTVTVREVLWAVSGLLNDSAPQFKRWPETELVGYLGDAEMAIAKYLPMLVARTDAVKLVAGSKQGIATVPAASLKRGDGIASPATTLGMELLGVVRNMGADGLTPGRVIRTVDRSLLDDMSPNWHFEKPAAVIKHAVHDPRLLLDFYVQPPVPDGADVFAEIQWAPQPAKVQNTGTPGAPLYAWAGASTLGLSVPDKCRDDAINYVCARAHMKHSQAASDQSKASMFANAFLQSLNAQVQTATGNNPNLKRLPFAPANLGTAS